ncbi:hypothetical protein [Duganella sp.]|uniref:hypothetical protein n=1 Tax=Duganella sp. TaxID=1904440 RepID=UPI0031D8CA81
MNLYPEKNPINPEVKYERVGKFIYGAVRHGGDIADVHNWMADELRMARPIGGKDAAQTKLLDDYLAKYQSDEQFSESHQRFMKMMERRRT